VFVLRHVIIQALRQEKVLKAILALTIALHGNELAA